jgi:hypothetical protein
MEEAVWLAGGQVGGHARRGGAPERDAAVAAVVVVEVAERPLAVHKEARLAVADALGDARQRECDPAHLIELLAFHLIGLHEVSRRTRPPHPSRAAIDHTRIGIRRRGVRTGTASQNARRDPAIGPAPNAGSGAPLRDPRTCRSERSAGGSGRRSGAAFGAGRRHSSRSQVRASRRRVDAVRRTELRVWARRIALECKRRALSGDRLEESSRASSRMECRTDWGRAVRGTRAIASVPLRSGTGRCEAPSF